MFSNLCWIWSKKALVSSFYKENNFKPCLTKHLLNMFKLWCERGIKDNYEHGFESSWLCGNSCRLFLLPKQWDGGHVVVPEQSCGSWTLFLCKHFRWIYATYFAHRNQASEVKLHFPPLIHSPDSSIGRGYTKRTESQNTVFCSYENSYICREDMSARFLNTINTDSEL